MIFYHRKTEKPALWITAYDPSWKNQDNPNLFRIRSYEDLPFIEDVRHIYSQITLHPAIWENQGRMGLCAFLRAFFYDGCGLPKRWFHFLWNWKVKRLRRQAKKDSEDFWFMFLPSGFPNGVIK